MASGFSAMPSVLVLSAYAYQEALPLVPAKEWPMFEWHIAHDTYGHLSKVGRVSTANFAK